MYSSSEKSGGGIAVSVIKTELLCFGENSEILGVDESVWLEFYLETGKIEGIKVNPDGNIVVFTVSGNSYVIRGITAEELAMKCGRLIQPEKPVDNTPH